MMKNTKIPALKTTRPQILAAAILAMPLLAYAASGSAAPGTPKKTTDLLGHTQNVMAFVKAYDANNDNILTQKEHDDFRRERFHETDTNKNGSIDLLEYVRELNDRIDARVQEEMVEVDKMTDVRFKALAGKDATHITRERFDQSGNAAFAAFAEGKLPQELEANSANADILNLPTNHSSKGMLALYDRNSDGELPREEFDAVREEQFKRTDSNTDGRLSRDEYAAEFHFRIDNRVHDIKVRQLRQSRVRFGLLDTNKDDRLDLTEYLTSSARAFAQLDRNGDGQLDAADAALPAPKRPQN